MSKFKTFTPPGTRQYITEASEQILSCFISGQPKFTADIPPRSGKSNIIYLVTTEAVKAHGCPFVIVLSPWIFLKEQVCNPDKIDDHIEIYNVNESIVTSEIDSFKDTRFWDIEDDATRPMLWSASLPKAYSQIADLKLAITAAAELCGVRPIVVFDEAHILGDQKMMGAVYDELLGEAFLISLTGTFYRRDGKPIKGANLEKVRVNENIEYKNSQRINPDQVIERDYTGSQTVYTQTPDFKVSWRDAWAQGTLAKINGVWVGHEVDGAEIATMRKKDIQPGTLRNIIESPKCVAEVARHMVHELANAKKYSDVTDRAAGMVIVGTDLANKFGEKEVNRHAKQVRDALEDEAQRQGHRWKIEIITMADNGETTKGADKLEAFRNKDKYDIIIVKMMGLVGLDVKRLKVLALLSTLREGPMLGQAVTRPLTVWGEAKGLVPRIIMLADPFMRDAFAQLVTEQGGEVSQTELALKEERIVEKEKEDNTQLVGDTTGIVGHINNHGAELQGDYIHLVAAIRKKYPRATDGRDDVDIIDGHAEGAYQVTQAEIQDAANDNAEPERPRAIRIDERLAALCDTFNKYTKDFANLIYSYASQQHDWVSARAEIARQAKVFAGIAVELGAERDIAKVEKAVVYLEAQIREVHRGRSA